MTLLPREKKILCLCLITAIGVVAYVSFIEPRLKVWQNLKVEVQAKEIELKRDRRAVRQKNRLEEKLELLKKEIRAVSGSWQPSAWLREIERTARKTKIQITSLEPQALKERGFYKKSQAYVNLKCSMDNLTDFLYQLRESGQMVNIERLQIFPLDADASSLKVEMLISAVFLVDEGREEGL
ncbi:MAG: hypothetical protein KAU12_00550 [Candidatus Omnitrophica bacterium]|nr:hypothetical protein [Candidatus Omnitrophota bacterium]